MSNDVSRLVALLEHLETTGQLTPDQVGDIRDGKPVVVLLTVDKTVNDIITSMRNHNNRNDKKWEVNAFQEQMVAGGWGVLAAAWGISKADNPMTPGMLCDGHQRQKAFSLALDKNPGLKIDVPFVFNCDDRLHLQDTGVRRTPTDKMILEHILDKGDRFACDKASVLMKLASGFCRKSGPEVNFEQFKELYPKWRDAIEKAIGMLNLDMFKRTSFRTIVARAILCGYDQEKIGEFCANFMNPPQGEVSREMSSANCLHNWTQRALRIKRGKRKPASVGAGASTSVEMQAIEAMLWAFLHDEPVRTIRFAKKEMFPLPELGEDPVDTAKSEDVTEEVPAEVVA